MKAAETTVLKLLQGSKVFLIPNFQRRYSWRAREWELLWSDLMREAEVNHSGETQEPEGHFLGSVVLHPAAGPASILMRHLVIDGQQRLTTILILIAALRDARAREEPTWDSREYDEKYLTNPYDSDQPDRLVPTELDRSAYTETIRRGNPTEGIGQAYHFFARKIEELIDEGLHTLEAIGNTLLLNMVIVEINTASGDSVNNIFNTLNSKGRPLTSADLVRNEMLLHIGEERGQAAYDKFWKPIESSLVVEKRDGFDDREFVSFLWSREVSFDPKATRQELFSSFERRLRASLDALPRSERNVLALQIFEDIYRDHILFLLLRSPMLTSTPSAPQVTNELRRALDRLSRWGSEPSTPLALWLLREAVAGRITQNDAADAVDVLVGYLGRRALAGVPTNLLNRILTPIAHRLRSRGDTNVVVALRDLLSTARSYWPTDADVLGAIEHQPIFVSAHRQVPFLLAEAERIESGRDRLDSTLLWAVHSMPQAMDDEWEEALAALDIDVEEARSLTHTLGNLRLESSGEGDKEKATLNELGAPEFFQVNRDIAFPDGLMLENTRIRSTRIAKILLEIFPGPNNSRIIKPTQARARSNNLLTRLEAALQAMPEGSWTTEGELVEFLGIDGVELRTTARHLIAPLARLIRDLDGNLPTWLTERQVTNMSESDNAVKEGSSLTSADLGRFVLAAEQPHDTGEEDLSLGAEVS